MFTGTGNPNLRFILKAEEELMVFLRMRSNEITNNSEKWHENIVWRPNFPRLCLSWHEKTELEIHFETGAVTTVLRPKAMHWTLAVHSSRRAISWWHRDVMISTSPWRRHPPCWQSAHRPTIGRGWQDAMGAGAGKCAARARKRQRRLMRRSENARRRRIVRAAVV